MSFEISAAKNPKARLIVVQRVYFDHEKIALWQKVKTIFNKLGVNGRGLQRYFMRLIVRDFERVNPEIPYGGDGQPRATLRLRNVGERQFIEYIETPDKFLRAHISSVAFVDVAVQLHEMEERRSSDNSLVPSMFDHFIPAEYRASGRSEDLARRLNGTWFFSANAGQDMRVGGHIKLTKILGEPFSEVILVRDDNFVLSDRGMIDAVIGGANLRGKRWAGLGYFPLEGTQSCWRMHLMLRDGVSRHLETMRVVEGGAEGVLSLENLMGGIQAKYRFLPERAGN